MVFCFKGVFYQGGGENVFILYVSSMFFNPNLEGTTSFADVAFSAGAFYFVNSFSFVRVKFVFNRYHILFDGFMWFEGGLDLFLSKDLCNIVSNSLDVRKVGLSIGVLVF